MVRNITDLGAFIFRFSLIILSIMIGSFLTGEEAPQEPDDTFLQEMRSLDWKKAGTYNLVESHSSLVVPKKRLILLGKEAQKFTALNGNGDLPAIEAVTARADYTSTVYFEYYNEGYVSLSDWKDIDAKQMLSSIYEGTEEANKTKNEKGYKSLHVVGWLQKPTIDKDTHTVFWAIETREEGQDKHDFNSIALRLGRNGYEKLICVGTKSRYKASGNELRMLLRAHSFDPGYRYNDHSAGDKLASYGIAALVTATAGVKIAKASGLILLLKKVWIVLAAGIIAGCKKLRKFFGKKKAAEL